MSNTNKSEKKAPRRRYFRRGSSSSAKTGNAQPVNESAKAPKESGTPENVERPSSVGERSENRANRRSSRSEKRRVRVERSGGGSKRQSSNSEARRRRQKRRRDEREDKIVEQVITGPSIIEAIAHEYDPPEDIYTYTHIIRSDQRDTYEFRSDHFSNTSRHLEDYEIDLSSILTESGEIALKKFFQDVPYDEDSDKINWEGSTKKPTGRSKVEIKGGQTVEDDFATAFDDFLEEDFQLDLEEEDIEEGEGKSLEQIYDELDMFTDMEI